MAEVSSKSSDIKKWADAALALGEFHTKADGTLLVDANNELPYSHRHLSNIYRAISF